MERAGGLEPTSTHRNQVRAGARPWPWLPPPPEAFLLLTACQGRVELGAAWLGTFKGTLGYPAPGRPQVSIALPGDPLGESSGSLQTSPWPMGRKRVRPRGQPWPSP